MALGVTTTDSLITQVSMTGVSTMVTQQGLLAEGFGKMAQQGEKAGRILTGLTSILGGVGVGMAGMRITSYMEAGGKAAAEFEGATDGLGAAFERMHTGTMANAESLVKTFGKLPEVTDRFEESARKAAFSLATVGSATPAQIESAMPAILDMTVAMQRMGKEGADLANVSLMVATAGAGGPARMLKRLIPDLDEAQVKTKGFTYLIEMMEKHFGGSAKAFSETDAGKLARYDNELENLQRTLGKDILPTMVTLTSVVGVLAHGFEVLDSAMHGGLGLAAGGVGVLALFAGAARSVAAALSLVGIMGGRAAVGMTEAAVAGSIVGPGAGISPIELAAAGGGASFFARMGGARGLLRGAGMAAGGLIAGEVAKSVLGEGYTGDITSGILKGAGIGAGIASLIPIPVISTAIGAAAGGLIGGGIGWWQAAHEGGAATSPLAQPKNPQHEKTNELLEQIADLMGQQTRVIIGGGGRAAGAWNLGDAQRAMYRVLTPGVAVG